jgi:LmbE family N-acetylglucosaminyl deacetylase
MTVIYLGLNYTMGHADHLNMYKVTQSLYRSEQALRVLGG